MAAKDGIKVAMIKMRTFKGAVVAAGLIGLVASQCAQADGAIDAVKGKSPTPPPPPIMVLNPAPQSSHNCSTSAPPAEQSKIPCNLFQNSVILLLAQRK